MDESGDARAVGATPVKAWRSVLLLFASVLSWASAAASQSQPYPGPDQRAIYQRLLKIIDVIPIFDNHGHPGYADDADVDQLPSPLSPNLSLRAREDNPELIAAAKALWGYPYGDLTAEHEKWLVQKKAELKQNSGDRYFDQVLDKVNIQTAIANRVAMPPYLDHERFRWVFFCDAFLFPFDIKAYAAQNPDLGVFVPASQSLLHRYMHQDNLSTLPADLIGYLEFVSRILAENQRAGGVGIKFEVAYLRPVVFGDPSREEAAAIYAKYYNRGLPTLSEYYSFQDYILRFLLAEAGRMHLPVQIHTAVGIGNYYNMSGGSPLNLENILRDPRYSNTTFVLLHGGYPFEHAAIWLTALKNVYLDSSLLDVYLYPSELKTVLKDWLSTYPDKIVFGSDAFPFNEALGAEEVYWLGVHTAREALAAALAEMVSEGDVSETKAEQMAHAFLHDTAAGVYANPQQ